MEDDLSDVLWRIRTIGSSIREIYDYLKWTIKEKIQSVLDKARSIYDYLKWTIWSKIEDVYDKVK